MENREKTYELRSEKVRSIVGQIPPALVRYGTIILFAVLMVLFGIAYFMPYKQVYSGTVTFYDISEPTTTAYISFANNKTLTNIDEPILLTVHLNTKKLDVRLRDIESKRDTLNRYPVVIEVNRGIQNIANLKNSTFDFTIVESSDNLLSHFLPKKKK